MVNHVYMYVPDTLSDWEVGYAISELNSGRGFKKDAGRYVVKTFGITKSPIVTMGGVTILPDLTLNDIKAENASLLLLPGADTWTENIHKKVLDKAKEFLDKDVPVAAICGATQALAAAGLLNDRMHTSNGLDAIKHFPAYKGEKLYRHESAVTDNNLITAPGVSPLEFAYHIIKRLGVFSPAALENWYGFFKTYDPKYIGALMHELLQT